MRRVVAPELVDQLSPDPVRLSESLGDLAWMNRYLGVAAGVIHQLGRLLKGVWPRRLSVLDVGAGGGDVLAAVGNWCARRKAGFTGYAVDLRRATARIAAVRLEDALERGAAGIALADARALPFRDRSVDVAISSTFLHHLEADGAVDVLREMSRVSRIGIAVTDLRRGPAGYLAAELLAHTVWRRHPYSRHDAPASMRAAFTLAEARALAEHADLAAHVEPQLWFRWALRWSRSSG